MTHDADQWPTAGTLLGDAPPRVPGGLSGDDLVPDGLLAAARGMRLLAAGVPLTLLLDLSLPVDSTAIAKQEGGSAGWLHG